MLTLPAVPNLPALIDDWLLKQEQASGGRDITGNATWRASLLGHCLRRQYLELHLHQPRRVEVDALGLRRFAIGHLWSEMFRRWFDEAGILLHEEYPVHDRDLDIGAHIDFIVDAGSGPVGIELKSMQSRWFWYRSKEKPTTASDQHLIQAATYDLLLRRSGITMPWVVICVSKDDLTMSQDVVHEGHREWAMERLQLLNEAKRTGVAPPCTCTDPAGEFGGSQWKWCPYWPGPKAEGKSPKPDPRFECCS